MNLRSTGASALALVLLLPLGHWKPWIRRDGEPVTWGRCELTYAVDYNGFPRSRMVPGRAAMRDITRVSGVTFRRVPWAEADIHIVLRKRNDGKLLGQTKVTHTSIIETARVSIFPLTYRHDRDTERDVFQHEFGHALGLGHVKDPDDLMAKRMVDDPDESGWAEGLGDLYSQC